MLCCLIQLMLTTVRNIDDVTHVHAVFQGKTFAYVYTPFEKAGEKLNEDAVKIFGNYNALNPSAFPSLRKMEVEVVEMYVCMRIA